MVVLRTATEDDVDGLVRLHLGSRLHDAAVTALQSAGYNELGLWVIDRNAPARALYERAGWHLDPSKELLGLDVLEVRYFLAL